MLTQGKCRRFVVNYLGFSSFFITGFLHVEKHGGNPPDCERGVSKVGVSVLFGKMCDLSV